MLPLDIVPEQEEGEEEDVDMEEPPHHEQPVIEEPLVAKGMAATLNLLRQQGQLQPLSSDKKNQSEQITQHTAWLLDLNKMRARHERERAQEIDQLKQLKRNAHSYREHEILEEKERTFQQRERKRADQERQHMTLYKPVVDLGQRDDYGEELTAKEAFRVLSYKFHGKMSGKTKMEKRRLRKEDEKQRQQLSDVRVTASGEVIAKGGVHSHALSLLADKQRHTGQAHVVLSSSGQKKPV
jgi:U4/U6.U5 tri-snRNP-associated protein 1